MKEKEKEKEIAKKEKCRVMAEKAGAGKLEREAQDDEETNWQLQAAIIVGNIEEDIASCEESAGFEDTTGGR